MIEVLGSARSIQLVVSLIQAGMLRLLVLNLIAAIILVAYSTAVQTWPMVGMNLAVAVIDVWYIARLRRPASPSNPAAVRAPRRVGSRAVATAEPAQQVAAEFGLNRATGQ